MVWPFICPLRLCFGTSVANSFILTIAHSPLQVRFLHVARANALDAWGIVLETQVDTRTGDPVTVVVRVVSGYPASGIVEPGDVLLAIAGEDLNAHFADGDLTNQHDDLIAMLSSGTALSLAMTVRRMRRATVAVTAATAVSPSASRASATSPSPVAAARPPSSSSPAAAAAAVSSPPASAAASHWKTGAVINAVRAAGAMRYMKRLAQEKVCRPSDHVCR
jgi:hypothetical protein